MKEIDVKAVLLDHGVVIKSDSGDELRADCRFCQPPDIGGHLYFSRETGQYYCHKCGAKGNLSTLGWLNKTGDYDPYSSDVEHQRIIQSAAEYYASSLSTEAREYLYNRKFTDETIAQFMLGAAFGRVFDHLKNRGYDVRAIQNSGLIRKDGRDYLHNRITVPYMESGQVVTIRGRIIPSAAAHGPKYLTLKGDVVRLFNRDALRTCPEQVLLCEGELDAIIAGQFGFAAVGVPGAQQFKERWADQFCDIPTVALGFDPDRAGEKGADKVLATLGPLIRVLHLPERMDINEFFLSGKTADDLQQLIRETEPWLETQLAALKGKPEYEVAPALRLLIPNLTRLDSFERTLYEKKISKTFSIPIDDVRSSVTEAEAASAKTRQNQEDSLPQMSDAERTEAEELLRDDQLIDRFLDDVEKIGLIGEDNNKVMLLLAFTSRITENPINLIVKGESSSGKSFQVDKVKMFMPPEEVLEFTAISPKALFHRKDSLAHKTVIIYERHGSEEADYSIRSMQSEKKLIFSMPVKDPDTNEWITKDIEIEGPVGFIETTTRSHIHPENETRCFELYTDESSEQTANILKQQRNHYLGREINIDSVVKVWQNAQRLLEPLPVHIPYADLIDFPLEPIRVRRDHQRFLTLIEVVCLLHQKQRERREINGRIHLIATLDDYAAAYALAEDVLSQTIKNLSPGAEKMLAEVRGFVSDEDGKPDMNKAVTVRDMRGLSGGQDRTVRRHLKDCALAGYLEVTQQGGNGKPYKYVYRGEPKTDRIQLTTPEELEQRLKEAETDTSDINGQTAMSVSSPSGA
ncbi:toprim domain-containing protein [Candidatus Zixiibacteriota bacterium]